MVPSNFAIEVLEVCVRRKCEASLAAALEPIGLAPISQNLSDVPRYLFLLNFLRPFLSHQTQAPSAIKFNLRKNEDRNPQVDPRDHNSWIRQHNNTE